MAPPEVRDRQNGFAAGLNTTADDAALQQNECRALRNARLSRRGAAEKRGGTQYVSSSALADDVMGGFGWQRTSSTQEMVIANGKLYTGTLGVPMSFTDRGGSFSTTVYPTFAGFKGPSTEGVYIADGGPLNFWDGTTLSSNIVNTPSVEAICAWGPRLFAVSGDTLYWSGTTSGINGHTLGATAGGGQAIVRTYGGQELIMPFPLKNALLLFHRQAISRFVGSTQEDIDIDAGTNGISGDVGTVAKRSVIGVENAAYFLTDRGAFAASESDVTPISSPLEETLAGLTKTQWSQVCAVHARSFNEIRWFIPGVGVYAYNYRTQGWSGPWDSAYATCTALWDTVDSDGVPVVMMGRSDGRVVWCDKESVWTDNVLSDGSGGSNYTWSVTTRRMFADGYTAAKSWRWAYVLGDFPDPANITVSVTTVGDAVTMALPYDASLTGLTYQWGDTSLVWGATNWTWGATSAIAVETAKIPLHGTHPWVDFTMTYAGNDSARLSIVDVMGYSRRRR